MSPGQRREMVDREHPSLPIVRQCALLGVSRSSLYYRAKEASEADLSLMGGMDRQYVETPFYGSRRMKAWLERQGIPVSRKRVQRLMRVMGLRAIYKRPHTSPISRIVNADGEMTRYRCRCPAIRSVEMGSESVSPSVW